MSGDRQWVWDPYRNAYYYIDHVNRRFIYEDGRTIEADQQAPRTPGTTPSLNSGGNTATSASTRSPEYPHQPGASANLIPRRSFQQRERGWFRLFRVLMWRPSEQPEPRSSAATAYLSNVQDENRIISGVGRYVVIEEPIPGRDYFLVLPIVNYGRQGVARDGVKKREHGIVYTGDLEDPPKPDPSERPGRSDGGRGMVPNAIRVQPSDPTEALHAMSRINYGEPMRIPVSARVHDVGFVHRESRGFLNDQFQHVQRAQEQEKFRTLVLQYRTEYQKREEKGQQKDAILQYLIATYRRDHPELTWEQAWEMVKRLLGLP
ncbi:hypothetical protein CKM354_000868900 [Cercospora kikuchii]|uniref:DUF6590 domain-containing protein n=1 Tax=Cercospora kikuchii TaxID=84275 RepID=A0A9P3FIN0_9PEZI|nr:uncharacterized protein CKM354_000868900 [Cercospora kikuchii]GIZ45527.1 hypothetical protein CKM354_000868900 [Cercospora kikuchii]